MSSTEPRRGALSRAEVSFFLHFYSICGVFSVTTTSTAERVERMFVVDVVVTGQRSSKQVEAAKRPERHGLCKFLGAQRIFGILGTQVV